jgi:hypothetical protein
VPITVSPLAAVIVNEPENAPVVPLKHSRVSHE